MNIDNSNLVITGSAVLVLNTVSNTTTAGNMWYNPTLGKIQFTFGTGNGTWSAGGALIAGRDSLAGAGIQNAGLAFGGLPTYQCTEEYNGTSWSTGGALIIGRSALAGAGTQNAGLAFGGFYGGYLACTEEYNGSYWSAGGA